MNIGQKKMDCPKEFSTTRLLISAVGKLLANIWLLKQTKSNPLYQRVKKSHHHRVLRRQSKTQCRNILNTFPFRKTPNLKLLMGKFPLKKTRKLAEWFLHIGKWEKDHIEAIRETETWSYHKSHHSSTIQN